MTVSARQRIWYLTGDLIACLLATLLFNVGRVYIIYAGTSMTFARLSADSHVALSYLAFTLVMMSGFAILGFYNNPSYKSRYEISTNAFVGALIGSLIIYFAIVVNDSFKERVIHYSLLAALCSAFFILVLCSRLLVRYLLIRRSSRGDDTFNVVVVGDGREAAEYARRLEHNNRRVGYRVVGLVNVNEQVAIDSPLQYPVIAFDNLQNEISRLSINAFIVLNSENANRRSIDIVNSLYAYGLTILLPIDFCNLITSRPKLTNIIGEPLVNITAPALSAAATNLKRCSDIVIAALSLVLILPLGVIISCLIKADSTGPIFYTQERVGYHRRKFKILKFRSMIVNAEPSGPVLSSTNDPRITKIGHFLRKYRLDELPQFWNVLRGDMSLVGPRPEREFFLAELQRREPAVFTIHNVRPGLTSLGVVKCGYATDILQMRDRLYFDLLYVENISFSLDLRILFHTVNTVITGKGI